MVRELPDAAEYLGAIPDQAELARLVENYLTYKLSHRNALLTEYFQGVGLQQLIEGKLKAKEIEISTCGGRILGAHSPWPFEKVWKTLARILYLRSRIDQKLTRRQANQQLLKKFGSSKAKDGGKSAIRKMTRGAELDKKPKLLPA